MEKLKLGAGLKAMMGGHVKTGAGPYEHTFEAAADVPSFALQKDMGAKLAPNQFEYLGGMKVASIDVQLAQEGRQSITVNLKGASQAFNDTTMDATAIDYRLDEPWDGINLFIKEADAEIGIVSSASLTISNNLDEATGYTIPKESEKDKAGTRQSLPAQFFTVAGSLTALLTNSTLINKGIDNTQSQLQLKLTRGVGDGSAGNEALTIDLPRSP
jgi:hypothetical protein